MLSGVGLGGIGDGAEVDGMVGGTGEGDCRAAAGCDDGNGEDCAAAVALADNSTLAAGRAPALNWRHTANSPTNAAIIARAPSAYISHCFCCIWCVRAPWLCGPVGIAVHASAGVDPIGGGASERVGLDAPTHIPAACLSAAAGDESAADGNFVEAAFMPLPASCWAVCSAADGAIAPAA
jgi:hypothetical protein